MGKIVVLDPSIHREQFFEMNVEYLNWIAEEMLERHNIDILTMMDITVREYVKIVIDAFLTIEPPIGLTYVIEQEDKMVGMGALKKHSPGIGEIKRMYVRSEGRGQGLGSRLFKKLVEAGKEFGYTTLRLETGKFMKSAQRIYRAGGFEEIDEYPNTEVPEPYRPHYIFMEKKL